MTTPAGDFKSLLDMSLQVYNCHVR